MNEPISEERAKFEALIHPILLEIEKRYPGTQCFIAVFGGNFAETAGYGCPRCSLNWLASLIQLNPDAPHNSEHGFENHEIN